MKSFLSLLITIALVGLVALGLLNFGVLLQENNNVNNTISDDSSMSAFNSSLNAGFTEFRNAATGFKNASESEQLEEPIGDLTLGSIFSAGIKFSKFIFTFPIALFKALKTNLGISAIVLNVILAIISIVAIFYWWKILKIGE